MGKCISSHAIVLFWAHLGMQTVKSLQVLGDIDMASTCPMT